MMYGAGGYHYDVSFMQFEAAVLHLHKIPVTKRHDYLHIGMPVWRIVGSLNIVIKPEQGSVPEINGLMVAVQCFDHMKSLPV